jgi:ATP-binding cassette subfamily B protein
MDNRRIIEHGSHDDLVAAGNLYADLFRLQTSGYAAADPSTRP